MEQAVLIPKVIVTETTKSETSTSTVPAFIQVKNFDFFYGPSQALYNIDFEMKEKH